MKIKVGVFFGGRSAEHEISIISAIQAINNFDKEKYDIVPIYITKKGEMYVGENIDKIEAYKNIGKLIAESQKVILVNDNERVDIVKYPLKKFGNNTYDYIDVAFPIVHGTNVEDGALQGYLKTLNVPFAGCDVLSSALGMDKYSMKAVLKDNDIPVLDCLCFDKKEYNNGVEELIKKVETKINYPVIVKPVNTGSSIGIKKAKNKDSLIEAIDYAFQFANRILIERAIENLREINCSVLGDYEEAFASECEEPFGQDEILSYEDKYLSGGKTSKVGGSKGMQSLDRKLPADITKEQKEEIQSLAIKTFQKLGCNGVARVDLMIDCDENKIYVNEINTIPGSLSFYLWNATDLKYDKLLEKIINLALKRQREEAEISYTFDTNVLENANLGGSKGSKI